MLVQVCFGLRPQHDNWAAIVSDAPRKSSGKQPTQNIGISIDGATIGGDVVAGNKIVTVLGSRAEARERRDQLILLEKVKQFWIKGVLEKSVHAEVLIELSKETRPEAVEHPWEMVLGTSEKENQPVPPGKKIVEVFDEMGHALLILGAPGSGKTITLLELARDLIARAESDPAQPIPVVFNLSSWAERRQPLVDWLADELSAKYQIPRRVGRKWLEANDISPLLDGLDEVRAEHREACVEAINKCQPEQGLPGLVVCSRIEDYNVLKARLKLMGAILIQPLTDEHIKDYLAGFGAKLASLYRALQRDETLKELASTPLMLSMMSLAYADVSLESVLSGGVEPAERRRRHLFEMYVERMCERTTRTKREIYSKAQTISWLSWMARGMIRQGNLIFLIERLQPSWLPGHLARWVYAIGSRVAGGLIIGLGLGSGLAVMLGFDETAVDRPSLVLLSWAIVRVVGGAVLGLLGGATAGPIAGLRFEWNARRSFSQMNLRQNLLQSVFNFLAAGFGPGSVFSIVLFILAWAGEGIVVAFVITLPFVLVISGLFGLIFGSRGSGQYLQTDVPAVEALNWSWGAAIRGAIAGLIVGSISGAILGFIFAASALLFMRPELSPPAPVRSPPLVFLAAMCVCGGPLAFFGAAAFGLVSGLRSKKIETRLIPNQGMWQSARNAVIGALLSSAAGVLVVGITIWLAGAVSALFSTNRFEPDVNLLPVWGVLLGVVGGMYSGGFAVVQHANLRLGLALTKSFPWNIARFLDYCADRIFLRKVGGGYIFIHRLLLEYFASLDENDIQRLAK